MKNTLKWHEDCARLWKEHYNANKEKLHNDTVNLKKSEEELNFYLSQIAKAKANGRDSFDREKFMVKKKN